MKLVSVFFIVVLVGQSCSEPFDWGWFANVGKTVEGIYNDNILPIYKGVKDVIEAKSVFENEVLPFINNAEGDLSSSMSNVSGVLNDIHQRVKDLPSDLVSFGVEKAEQLVESFTLDVNTALLKLKQEMQYHMETIETDVGNLVGKAEEHVNKTMDGVLEKLKNLIAEKVGQHGECAEKISEDVGEFTANLLRDLIHCPLDIKAAAKELSEQAQQVAKHVPGIVSDVVEQFKTCLKNIKTDKNCIDVIKNGAINKLKEAVKEVDVFRVASTAVVSKSKGDLGFCALNTLLNACTQGAAVVGKLRECLNGE